MKTLITGGKSSQALKLLKAFTGQQVLLADYGDQPSISTAQYQFVSLGDKNEDIIAHNLLNVCLDHQADTLLPLYQFELEAVAKSAVLFEEFNIHILLPDVADLQNFIAGPAATSPHWAVYQNGALIYASDPAIAALAIPSPLNGVFYVSPEQSNHTYTLFTIV